MLVDYIILVYILSTPLITMILLFICAGRINTHVRYSKNVRPKYNKCIEYKKRCKYANRNGGCLFGCCVKGFEYVKR